MPAKLDSFRPIVPNISDTSMIDVKPRTVRVPKTPFHTQDVKQQAATKPQVANASNMTDLSTNTLARKLVIGGLIVVILILVVLLIYQVYKYYTECDTKVSKTEAPRHHNAERKNTDDTLTPKKQPPPNEPTPSIPRHVQEMDGKVLKKFASIAQLAGAEDPQVNKKKYDAMQSNKQVTFADDIDNSDTISEMVDNVQASDNYELIGDEGIQDKEGAAAQMAIEMKEEAEARGAQIELLEVDNIIDTLSAGACQHELLRGKNKGTPCGKPSVVNGRCRSHQNA